jgi:hypothetical protein
MEGGKEGGREGGGRRGGEAMSRESPEGETSRGGMRCAARGAIDLA